MAVTVGSARIDENGKAYGGKAGDQTGKEVSRQSWYLNSKGWILIRPDDPTVAENMAHAMDWACDNPLIGYDQYERNTLYKALDAVGWQLDKLAKPVECDCSALIRVCARYAGIDGIPADTRTGNMPTRYAATGAFTVIRTATYCNSSDYLKRGDILVTKTSGHTVMVLSDGPKAGQTVRPMLRKGDKGDAVRQLQQIMLAIDPKCLPKYGADGDFGAETLAAVLRAQRAGHLEVDGIVGPLTWAALEGAVKKA